MLKSRSGKYNSVGEEEMAYSSLTPSGKESFYSVSTIREKCDQCDLEDRCCEIACEVFEDKVAMDLDSPCSYCVYESEVCYAANDIKLKSNYRLAIREFKVRTRDGIVWSYNDIEELEDKELKLLLGMRFINMYLRAIGRGDLVFGYRESEGRCQVRFIGSKYSFKGHISALAVLDKAWPYTLKQR